MIECNLLISFEFLFRTAKAQCGGAGLLLLKKTSSLSSARRASEMIDPERVSYFGLLLLLLLFLGFMLFASELWAEEAAKKAQRRSFPHFWAPRVRTGRAAESSGLNHRLRPNKIGLALV